MNAADTILFASIPTDGGLFWIAILGIAAVFMVFAKLGWSLAEMEDRRRSSSKQDQRRWLACPKCNELAAPISKTKDRYRCSHCSLQFAAALSGGPGFPKLIVCHIIQNPNHEEQ